MKDSSSTRENGFTIIELTLALAYVAFIMTFIVVVLVQVMNIYNKGIAMRQIDQTGRQLSADVADQTRFNGMVNLSALSADRLCVGGVSYIWNLTDQSGNFPSNTPANTYSGTTTNFGLVRVVDPTQSYCQASSGNYPSPPRGSQQVTELVSTNVAILKFTAAVSSNGLLSIDVVLSTSGQNVAQYINNNWTCASHGDNSPNQFCAVGEFNNIIYQRGN